MDFKKQNPKKLAVLAATVVATSGLLAWGLVSLFQSAAALEESQYYDDQYAEDEDLPVEEEQPEEAPAQQERPASGASAPKKGEQK